MKNHKKADTTMNVTGRIVSVFTTLFLVLFLACGNLMAQQADSQATEYEPQNRLSIGLQGGAATGNMNISTKMTGVVGANIRYSVNPIVSIQGNILTGEFLSDNMVCDLFDPSFENRYWQGNIQGHFNMMQLLSRDVAPYGVNLYTLLGVGFIQNDVTARIENPILTWENFEPESNTDPAFYYQFGLGLRVKLNERFDIFTQFDYNITDNDRMDGFDSEPLRDTDLYNSRNDHFMNFTAGIQLKLGQTGRKNADWNWKTAVAPPPPPAPAPEPAPDLTDRLSELEDQLAEKEQMLDELYNKLEALDDVVSVERTENGMMVTYDTEVMFDFDSYALRGEAIMTLNNFVNQVSGYDEIQLTVVGHTCNIGSAEYNEGLSENRAESVVSFLVNHGFDSERLSGMGMGLTQPKYDNSTEEGRSMNRRVEILIE